MVSRDTRYKPGHKVSVEDRIKISITKTKFFLTSRDCIACKEMFFVKSNLKKKFCERKCFLKNGSKFKPPRTLESRMKLSVKYMGAGNPGWRGGLTKDRYRGDDGVLHKRWREQIFLRDNWRCVKCNSKKGIQADHIQPYALFPDIRWELSNGQTLCRKCHGKKTSWELKHYWKNQYGSYAQYALGYVR